MTVQRHVEVVDHDPTWAGAFSDEATRLRVSLEGNGNVLAIHHIGSTAVLGICAKPIIDIMPVVRDITLVDTANAAMQTLGYEAMGEFGIAGRRYFHKDTHGKRTYHVHVFAEGSEHISRHLAFRDYLRAHPEDAARYSALKQQLAAAHPQDIEAYIGGKNALIQTLEQTALSWLQSVK
jgi:GrpB-like predicted nucleotidyltransferase (UPF0157 family)